MMAVLLAMLHCAPIQEADAVTARIEHLNTHMSHKRAKYLAKQFVAAGKKYHIDPHLMVAIGMVESRLKPGVVSEFINKGKPTVDRGLMQINDVWVRRWDLDPQRLIDDDGYNIWTAARLLRILKRDYEERLWYLRYHSSWEPAKKKYTKDIRPFLPIDYKEES